MRIVTWNTWWCFGPWQERQPLLRAAVVAQRPDVVLLQETWPAQAQALAEATGLAVIDVAVGDFEPQGTDPGPAGNQFGNAVLARPGQASPLGMVPLSSRDDGAPRNGLAIRVEIDGPPVMVVATHLNHVASASDVRTAQLRSLGEWIDGIWPEGPVVLGGDLNLTPYSPEYTGAVLSRWVDLWRHTRPDDPGATMVPENPRFRDTDWMADRNGPGAPPGVRFDYLLGRRGPDGPVGLEVDAIEVIGGARHHWPSDHLGLVADIRPTR